MSLEDELEIVKSIYCRDGEFCPKVSENALLRSFALNMNFPDPEAKLCTKFYVPDNYPENPPRVDVILPKLTRDSSKKLNEELRNFLTSSALLHNEMLLDAISWVRDNISKYAVAAACHKAECSSNRQLCIMRIDHMRARNNYLKTLRKWTEQLYLVINVVFYKHFIFLVVEGFEDGVEEFIKRLRSRKVDVDSSGHSCKERMMTILFRERSSSVTTLPDFLVHEVQSSEKFDGVFISLVSKEIFSSVLEPVII